MAKVTFVQSYRGYLTNERFFDIGESAEIDDATANVLEQRGFVVITVTQKEVEKNSEKPKSKGGKVNK